MNTYPRGPSTTNKWYQSDPYIFIALDGLLDLGSTWDVEWMDLGLCKDQFLIFLCMYYVFCMHEKELVRKKSLFFYKQRVRRSSGFIPARVDLFSVKCPLKLVHLRSSVHGAVCFDSPNFSLRDDEWQLLSPSSYFVYDTNLAGGCPLHVAPQVSIFVIIISYFGQLVKGIMVSLVFPRKGETWWFS